MVGNLLLQFGAVAGMARIAFWLAAFLLLYVSPDIRCCSG